MTLLTICNNVVDQVGTDELSTVVNNSERSARRLLALANRGGKLLAQKRWSVLIKEATITTADGTASYAVESDFKAIVADTVWDRTNYWKMRGGLSPVEWQIRKSAIVATTSVRKTFRVKPDSNAKKIFIDPTPTAVETLVYEYYSNNWCQSSGGSGQAAWAADTDTGILDEDLLELDLLWRYRGVLGLPYIDERKDAEDAIETAYAQDGGARKLMPRDDSMLWPINLPEATFDS
ncbi:MAG: hypothetical protein ACR2PM_12570 [Hyphomicrobiales bacterium]